MSGQQKIPGIVDLVLAQLTDDERAKAVVYLDDDVHPAGRSVVGGVEIKSGRPYHLAFIDQKPGANWMHSCRYLVIGTANGAVTSIKADRPPALGKLPPSWHMVWRAKGVEDWKLLPGSTEQPHKNEK